VNPIASSPRPTCRCRGLEHCASHTRVKADLASREQPECFAARPGALSSAELAMPSARVIWTALTRVLLLGLLAVLGCKPAQSGGASPGDGASYYEESPGGGGGYGYDDYGGMEVTGAGTMDVRREYAADMVAEAPAAPPADPSTTLSTTPAPVETPKLEPAPGLPGQVDVPKQISNKRQIIYTATMQVSVYDVAHSVAQAEALPDRLGGWLHQRTDNQLILRIPAEKLHEAMDLIAELGVVDYRLLESLDVTAAYTDLESRIRILTEMHAQLTKLLAQAKTVEQALEIRKALDQITMELELARARMRELSKSIAFSTLIVQFVARGPDFAVPSSNDPFPWVVELGVEATEYR
jgi:chemotaxis protein histidine kinase CheA